MASTTKRRMWPIALGITLALAAVGWGVWYWQCGTYHFSAVDPGKLYRDGNRGLREFAHACRRAPIKTVVILVDDTEIQNEPFAGELKFCADQQIRIVRLPIPLGGWPTTEQIRQFLQLAQNPQCQPVLVHCAQGVRRTGMMAAAYQQSVLGYDSDKAKSLLQRFGHSDRTVNDIRRFIDIYDAKMQVVKEELPQSKE